MLRRADELFDRNHDDELDFFERWERDEFEEAMIRQNSGKAPDDDLFGADGS